MRAWHALRARLRSLLFPAQRESDLHEELQLHLAREAERLAADGMSEEAARVHAHRTFGAVTAIEEACRDARGTRWLGDLLRDTRFALRSFRRTPLVTATIVTTLALGLGLVTAVFTFLNVFLFRVDDVRDPHSLFAVVRGQSDGVPSGRVARPEYDALMRDTSAFTSAFATTRVFDALIDGRRMEGSLTTGNFFEVLGVTAAAGRTYAPADDGPGMPPVIVLSHRAWTRHFSSDAGVLGRIVLVNGVPCYVIGVMPQGFRGLVVRSLDFWAPLSAAGVLPPFRERAVSDVDLDIVGRLAPGYSPTQALAQLRGWEMRRAAERGDSQPARPLTLEPRTGTVPQPRDAVVLFTPLFVAFGLVLLIGCANIANLLFARAVARQREIGVRLAIGASRRRVMRQLLTENLLLALASAAAGFLASRLILTAIVQAVVRTYPPDFGIIDLEVPAADWRVALFLVGGAAVSTLFFALAPSLTATRISLIQAMRGDSTPRGRPGARHALVGVQVAGSALLLTCAAVFLRSTLAAASIDPGVRILGTLNVAVLDEQKRGAVLDVLRTEPGIESVAASWPDLRIGSKRAFAEGAAGKVPVTYRFVSPAYFDVLDIDLVRGRGFTDAERSAAAVAVVSEAVARQLWPDDEAIGRVLTLDPDAQEADAPVPLTRTPIVVGVARDVAGIRFGDVLPAGTGIYLPIAADAAQSSLVALARGDAARVRSRLVERMMSLDPDMAQVTTLENRARMVEYFLALPFWLTLVLGTLALLLTVSGLFSVLSYLVAQRTRDIGVRMALGASRRRIGTLVLSQTTRPVGIGLLVGAGSAGLLGAVLLSTPAAEAIGSTVRVFDPLAYAASILCIIPACVCAALIPARRAARIAPLSALKQD